MMVLLSAFVVAIVGLQTQPPWVKSELKETSPVLRSVREGIQSKYGLVPENARLDSSESQKAFAEYTKSKKPEAAFKAIYLTLASQADWQTPNTVGDVWARLPANDYETARLRFIWTHGMLEYKQADLGERLLKVDPKDAEVMWALSHIYSHFGPRAEWRPERGVELARKAVQLAPGPASYLRCADAYITLYGKSKSQSDGRAALDWFVKYKRVAKPDDKGMKRADRGIKWLRSEGF